MSDDTFPPLGIRIDPAADTHCARWLVEKSSRAVVACSMRGHGAVICWVGMDFYLEIEEAGLTDLGDLGLDDAPFGLSIWEGRYKTITTGNPLDGTDYDTEPVGAFRDLTDDEWKAIRDRRLPWDECDWLIPELHEEAKQRAADIAVEAAKVAS